LEPSKKDSSKADAFSFLNACYDRGFEGLSYLAASRLNRDGMPTSKREHESCDFLSRTHLFLKTIVIPAE